MVSLGMMVPSDAATVPGSSHASIQFQGGIEASEGGEAVARRMAAFRGRNCKNS